MDMQRVMRVTCFVCVLLAGCNGTVVHYKDSFPGVSTSSSPNGRVDTLSMDASQWVTVLGQNPVSGGNALGGTNGDPPSPWKYCAQPSPDTMTSLTAGVAAALKNSHVSADVAGSITSSAAMIGLRTQSITLLRDEAYRLCEGYWNGAIDRPTFSILHRRLQNVMVAILAVEQLTGYARPTSLVIGGSSTGQAASNLQDLQAAYDKATKDEATAKAAVDTAQKAVDDNKAVIDAGSQGDDAAKASAKQAQDKAPALAKTLDDAKATQAAADATVSVLKGQLDIARAPSATAQMGASFAPSSTTTTSQSAADMATVSAAVVKIVENATDKDLTQDFCINYWESHSIADRQGDPVNDACTDRMKRSKLETIRQAQSLKIQYDSL